ncbi:hypothetical protein U8V72_28340 [Priestia filamentosa]|uniref:hypothetical protein n=1 Tax=Priestia filamentosa TaxID=1402861 RepID=UPI003977E96F
MGRMSGLFIVGLILIVTSAIPVFYMGREWLIHQQISNKYAIEHVYEEQGFPDIIKVQEIKVNGKQIELIEEPTGKKASLTAGNVQEEVGTGDIVKLHILVDGQEVSKADEIRLSSPNQGSRYFSWLDILTVNDRIAIVQRLTDDNADMEKREWKIIWIDKTGSVKEEHVSYATRSDNPLAVRLIDFSGTSLMQMGYYSDISTVFPTIFFPLLYPFITGVLGILLCIIGFVRQKNTVEQRY